MSVSYLDRGEGRIAYDVQGEGPLVICVPGMGDLRSVFRFTVPALLAAGYRVAQYADETQPTTSKAFTIGWITRAGSPCRRATGCPWHRGGIRLIRRACC
jgi:hypothetical protein